MSIFSPVRVGTVIKVNGGALRDKFAMIVKEYKKGVAVIVEQSDWPTYVSMAFNAIYITEERITELSEEEQTLLKLKFPNPSQFK